MTDVTHVADSAVDEARCARDRAPQARGAIRFLHFYQRRVSPIFGPRCRYYPTCSNYALQAFERFGSVRGFILAAWRLMRCNQFSNGGVDDVPDTFRLSWKNYDSWADHETVPRDIHGVARVKE